MTTVLAFVGVLLVLVLVHEFGHFYTAKKTGMGVEEFGFGFPPRIASVKKGDTRYSLNLLPLGGFVKIKGENGDDHSPDSFASKPVSSRLLVLSAGVIMNIVLAWVLLSIALMAGTPQVAGEDLNGGLAENHRIMIGGVAPDSPAKSAGFESGDIILRIDNQDVNSLQFVQDYSRSNSGKELTYGLRRDGDIIDVKVIPRENPPPGQGVIGVQLVEVADVRYPWYEAIWKGLVLTWDYLRLTIMAFGQLIGQLFGGPSVSGELAGPVGIAILTGKLAKMGFVALIQFTAILSINLAIINALPIPALDGGRIAFLVLEAFRGKKVRAKIEQYSHAVGFILLLALMLIITFRDVAKHFFN